MSIKICNSYLNRKEYLMVVSCEQSVVRYTPPVYTFPVVCCMSSSIPFHPRTRGTNAHFLKRDVSLPLKESEELYKHADKWYGKCVHEFGLSFLSSGICHVPFNWFVLMYHPSSVITVQYSYTVPYREGLWSALVKGQVKALLQSKPLVISPSLWILYHKLWHLCAHPPWIIRILNLVVILKTLNSPKRTFN